MKLVWLLIYTVVLPPEPGTQILFDVNTRTKVYSTETECEINKEYIEMQSRVLLIPHNIDCLSVEIGE